MLEFPNALAGGVTIAALIGLGLFVYPWLLARGGGIAPIAIATALLAALFYRFDRGSGASAAASAAFALVWAIAPALVGAIVHRLERRPPPDGR